MKKYNLNKHLKFYINLKGNYPQSILLDSKNNSFSGSLNQFIVFINTKIKNDSIISTYELEDWLTIFENCKFLSIEDEETIELWGNLITDKIVDSYDLLGLDNNLELYSLDNEELFENYFIISPNQLRETLISMELKLPMDKITKLVTYLSKSNAKIITNDKFKKFEIYIKKN